MAQFPFQWRETIPDDAGLASGSRERVSAAMRPAAINFSRITIPGVKQFPLFVHALNVEKQVIQMCV